MYRDNVVKLFYFDMAMVLQIYYSCKVLLWSNSPTNYLRNPRISKKSMCANKFGCVPNKLGRAFRLRKRPLTEKFVVTLFT